MTAPGCLAQSTLQAPGQLSGVESILAETFNMHQGPLPSAMATSSGLNCRPWKGFETETCESRCSASGLAFSSRDLGGVLLLSVDFGASTIALLGLRAADELVRTTCGIRSQVNSDDPRQEREHAKAPGLVRLTERCMH